MNLENILVALLVILSILFLYNKFKKNDRNCDNGNCNCE